MAGKTASAWWPCEVLYAPSALMRKLDLVKGGDVIGD